MQAIHRVLLLVLLVSPEAMAATGSAHNIECRGPASLVVTVIGGDAAPEGLFVENGTYMETFSPLSVETAGGTTIIRQGNRASLSFDLGQPQPNGWLETAGSYISVGGEPVECVRR